jgi:hypothetical protein
MFSYEVSSTSPEALHHDREELPHWHLSQVVSHVEEAANAALFAVAAEVEEIWEFLVKTEMHTLSHIAEALGIHEFAHHLATKKLPENSRVVLRSDGILEIHRPGALHPTSFPVVRKQLLAA